MLADMRSVKMMGLTRLFMFMVQELRVHETKQMAGFRWYIVWQNVVQNFPSAIAPPLTFSIYAIQAIVRGKDSISTTQAFTSLSIISLLTGPASKLLSAVSSTAAAVGCFDRIQKFLLCPSREDTRRLRQSSTIPSKCAIQQPDTMSIEHLVMGVTTSKPSTSSVAIFLEDVDIRPVASAEIVLHGASFEVNSKSLTMIIGPVGSGKTTLLKAILGEAHCESGVISVSSRHIAFCAQTPWLPNTTIRNAVCGYSDRASFDEEWYSVTLQACALDQDLASLPHGDETMIGSGSTMLSGGQQHRVALARALYARAKIVILDDVLSALDTNTTDTVMKRLFGISGLFKRIGSTVVLVTHASQCQNNPMSRKLLTQPKLNTWHMPIRS